MVPFYVMQLYFVSQLFGQTNSKFEEALYIWTEGVRFNRWLDIKAMHIFGNMQWLHK